MDRSETTFIPRSKKVRARERDRHLLTELRKQVWAWDPVGLAGAPDDEYDCLVGPLASWVVAGIAPRLLAERLEAEITQHFGVAPWPARTFAEKVTRWYGDFLASRDNGER